MASLTSHACLSDPGTALGQSFLRYGAALAGGLAVAVSPGLSGDGQRSPGAGLARITSYNVCYTKLLRIWLEVDAVQLPAAIVGKQVDALYQFELLAAPRGKRWYLTRRQAEEDSVACRSHRQLIV